MKIYCIIDECEETKKMYTALYFQYKSISLNIFKYQSDNNKIQKFTHQCIVRISIVLPQEIFQQISSNVKISILCDILM